MPFGSTYTVRAKRAEGRDSIPKIEVNGATLDYTNDGAVEDGVRG
jgi:hypothetical protein